MMRAAVFLLFITVLPCSTVMTAAAERDSMKAMQVACAQLASQEDIQANAEAVVRTLEAESRKGTRLAAFPECFLTSYNPQVIRTFAQKQIDDAIEYICTACKRFDIYAVVGSAYQQDGKWYNGAYVIGPQGQIVKRYTKMHVVLPKFFKNGDQLAIFHVDNVPMTVIICHDERYPELVRIPVLAGARVCLYISCEQKDLNKWDNYRSQVMARAVENQISVIHCNAGDGGIDKGSHGHSRIINPVGQILAEAGTENDQIIRAVIHPEKSKNDYASNGAATPCLGPFWAEGLRVLKEQNPDFFKTASQSTTEPY